MQPCILPQLFLIITNSTMEQNLQSIIYLFYFCIPLFFQFTKVCWHLFKAINKWAKKVAGIILFIIPESSFYGFMILFYLGGLPKQ